MSPRQTSRENEPDVTPKKFAETTPPSYPGSDYSFTLQAVLEIKGSLGELKQQVQHLSEASREHGKELKRIGLVIYAAGAVLTIAAVIGGYFMGIIKDVIVEYIKHAHP